MCFRHTYRTESIMFQNLLQPPPLKKIERFFLIDPLKLGKFDQNCASYGENGLTVTFFLPGQQTSHHEFEIKFFGSGIRNN